MGCDVNKLKLKKKNNKRKRKNKTTDFKTSLIVTHILDNVLHLSSVQNHIKKQNCTLGTASYVVKCKDSCCRAVGTT